MTKHIPVVVCRTHPKATIPTYRTENAAGFDLIAVDYKLHTYIDKGKSHLAYLIRTGLKVAIPEGYCMKIYANTALAQKHHARPVECVGIIDCDYRDEIIIKLIVESGARTLHFSEGMCVAQGVIEEVAKAAFEDVTEDKFAERDAEGQSGHTDTPANIEPRSAEKGKAEKLKAEK
ncbi:dUTP diphosphatase [Xenorhabdus szentirmaii]|uniref:dUTP diphosphatase n=2 Tax=Xenorhabdus szentirmaii TaxID=290112 RepID=UPI0019BC29BF|nr:dUTP diphosphatase [Xenorhabdus sp. 38]MBD2780841.1 dUTP diphosphatase [Xenorhabdus sp. 38]